MNNTEKQLYLREQCNLLMGAVVIGLETKTIEENVSLESIKLKHPNGDEFIIRPFDWQQLHVIQTYWGQLVVL